MTQSRRSPVDAPSPLLVALSGWLLPGAGYWLLGQKHRALVIGITILCLWVTGLAIGGIRVIEVPKYDNRGRFLPSPHEVSEVEQQKGVVRTRSRVEGTTLLQEIGRKPWSIAQGLTGPVAIVSGGAAIYASRPDPETGEPRAAMSHARMWEIPVLYTAVAGMLNLIAIIDAAYRARQQEGRR